MYWARVTMLAKRLQSESKLSDFLSRLLYFGKDGTAKESTLLCNVLFFDNVVNDDPSHIIFVIEVNWQSAISELEERVDCCCISMQHCRLQAVLVVVVDATQEVFCLYCHNPLVAFVWSTRVWDPHYPCPFNVMRLPRGFHFKICTSL